MTKDTSDDRSPMAIAIEWSSRLIAIGLEMALPAAGGYWLDLRIGTSPVFVILGAMLGFAAGMFHLLQIARQQGRSRTIMAKNVMHRRIGPWLPASIAAKEPAVSRRLFGGRRALAAAVILPLGWVISGNRTGIFGRRGGGRSLPAGGLDRLGSERAAPQAATCAGLGSRGHDGSHGNPSGGRIGRIFSWRPPSRRGLSILPCCVLPGNACGRDHSLSAWSARAMRRTSARSRKMPSCESWISKKLPITFAITNDFHFPWGHVASSECVRLPVDQVHGPGTGRGRADAPGFHLAGQADSRTAVRPRGCSGTSSKFCWCSFATRSPGRRSASTTRTSSCRSSGTCSSSSCFAICWASCPGPVRRRVAVGHGRLGRDHVLRGGGDGRAEFGVGGYLKSLVPAYGIAAGHRRSSWSR